MITPSQPTVYSMFSFSQYQYVDGDHMYPHASDRHIHTLGREFRRPVGFRICQKQISLEACTAEFNTLQYSSRSSRRYPHHYQYLDVITPEKRWTDSEPRGAFQWHKHREIFV